MSHTPGPWVIDDTTDDYEISIVGYPTWPCERFGNKGEWDVCKLEKLDGHPDEEWANARLIEASPEMLQALQGIMPVLDGVPMSGVEAATRTEAARAAIAKATGAGA